MDYIYDYMLHLLTEYAKLLRYKPTIPENAVEICTESMACPAQGLHREERRRLRPMHTAATIHRWGGQGNSRQGGGGAEEGREDGGLGG